MEIRVVLDRIRLNHAVPGPLHLMVGIDAPEVEESKRQPIDMMLVLDVSGSMSESANEGALLPLSKLMLMKQAVRSLVELLRGSDRVGIVVYSTQARTLVPIGELTSEQRRNIIETVANLSTEGNTDMVGGLLRALGTMAECPKTADRTRRVILFTDGQHNVGVRGHGNIMAALSTRLDHATPVTTIGFGAGLGTYDPEILTSIATASGGNFYHAQNPDGLIEVFGAELGALRSVAAQDVRVKVRTAGKVSVKRVLNPYSHTIASDGTSVEMGNIYGGEKQFVVIELDVPSVDKVFPRDVLAAEVTVNGIEVNKGEFEVTREVHFRYTKPADAETEANPAVEEQRVRLLAAQAIEEAYRKAAAQDYAGAVQVIDVVIVLVEKVRTQEGQTLLTSLRAIRMQVATHVQFAANASSVKATGYGHAARRSTGVGATGFYSTEAVRRATQDIKAVRPEDLTDPNKPKKN